MHARLPASLFKVRETEHAYADAAAGYDRRRGNDGLLLGEHLPTVTTYFASGNRAPMHLDADIDHPTQVIDVAVTLYIVRGSA